jgi:phosphate uptake regulator
MEAVMNDMATKLLELSRKNASAIALRQSLASSLRSVSSIEFDTEEREFICDEVARLGRIVNVKVSNALNRWLYGALLGTFINVFRGPAKN